MLTRISNTPRNYAWGSKTLIAELEGREPTGEPEAEVWFGDHPGSPSLVHDGSQLTLDRWLPARGAASGSGERLPYLLKLLAAGAPLSIQAHPSKAQAEEGFAREERAGIPRDAVDRNYRDDNHKPELIVAVSERFRALAGIRELEQTLRLLDALDGGSGVAELRDRLRESEPSDALRATIGWLLGGEAQEAVDEVIAAASAADVEGFAEELSLTRTLAEAYPGDPGVVVALLMNLVSLSAGEAIFVPAGVLHAYVDGLGVELMAASDNVLRGGLTPKHIDVDELLGLLDATPSAPPLLRPRPLADHAELFDAGVSDFSLVRVVLDGTADEGTVTVPLHGTTIVLAARGTPTVATPSRESLELTPGAAALVTADEGSVAVSGRGELFLAMPGRH